MRRVDQLPERRFTFTEVAAREHSLDGFTPQIAHGDRRVGTNSEEALVVAGRHRRDELSLARRQWAGMSHHRLREREEVLGATWIIREQMPEIRLPIDLRRRVFEMRNEHVGERRSGGHRRIAVPGRSCKTVPHLFSANFCRRGVASIEGRRDISG